VTVEAQKLAEICVSCTTRVKEAVACLETLKQADAILRICGEIDRLETEADHVFSAALAKLFREEPDAREIIKLKEVYQLLEAVTDRTSYRNRHWAVSSMRSSTSSMLVMSWWISSRSSGVMKVWCSSCTV